MTPNKITYIDNVVSLVEKETGIRNQNLLQLYSLLVLTKGTNVTAKDVHDGWAVNMNYRTKTDRCFGHDHLSLVPFEQLSEECQNKDNKYVKALIKVAKKLNL